MSDTREKLRQLASNPPPVSSSGPLYQWLHEYYDVIAELRLEITGWREIAKIASEDGILIGSDRASLKKIEKKWRAVCKMKDRTEARRAGRTLTV